MFNHSSELSQQLQTALSNKGADYLPRTRYLDDEQKPLYINRLIFEDSPYLLQHAHNPVDWYPWGEEAFSDAKQQNKPVFLSIGYSTCHWCHVMEEESFDNEDVAKVMNEHFICIKVDRELHPDVDSYYMTAVMMMQGQGGWPMSSFLTPERKPFFGATYFRPGQFLTLMHRVDELWHQQQQDLLEQAEHFNQQIANAMTTRQSLNEIGMNVIDLTAQALMNHYDPQYAGFGGAPKFPNEPYLYFLFDYVLFKQDKTILDNLNQTLNALSCGGIYDHIAGGFHRYATDANWLIPHFEKMLYNQANLAFIFTQAWQITQRQEYKRVAEETLDYVLREMTNEQGAFYSATDADSEGEEGLFFVWDKTEIESLLGNEAEQFIQYYQITETGNFEGKNIPHLTEALDNHDDYESLVSNINKQKSILLEARNKRIPPLLDDKILTAWNGMLIKTLTYTGQILKQQHYIDAAIKAATAVLDINRDQQKKLCRASLQGQASIPALQEDYAYLAEALLYLYDATNDQYWLEQSNLLTDEMLDACWDEDAGAFFMSRQTAKALLPAQIKDSQDNATASGNSVALNLLSRLWRRSGNKKYQDYAQQLVRSFSDDITQRPYSCSYMMKGIVELLADEQTHYCYAGNGHVIIDANVHDKNKLILKVNLAEGIYLNELKETQVPLYLEIDNNWTLDEIQFPASDQKSVNYQDTPINFYQGQFEITCILKAKHQTDLNIIKLKLTLQTCDTEQCMAPEQHTLTLIVH